MRKYVALFLAFVLVMALAGCNHNVQQPETPSYSSTDLMLYQADAFSRLIAMSAMPDYLTALSFPQEIISRSQCFTQAITGEVMDGKLLKDAPQTLQTSIISICGQVCGSTDLATCSSLLKSTTMRFAKKPKQPAAVYLRYSEECHFVVMFTPEENDLVSLWAYPLFAEAAQQVLQQCFSEAKDLTGDAIRSSCEKGSKANFQAKSAGQAIDAARYTAMAETFFSQATPIDKQSSSLFTSEAEVIELVSVISQYLCQYRTDMTVYTFSAEADSQLEQILAATSYPQQLEESTRQLVYLGMPNQYVNTHSVQWISANAIVRSCLRTTAPALTAEEGEEPVLVLISVADSLSALLSIYPTAYRTYLYSFSIVGASYMAMQIRLPRLGMQPME
jgi:hypothetical protein